MYKNKIILILFLMLCCAAFGYAQSFLGVEYGTPYDEAFKYWQEKYKENCKMSGDDIIIDYPTIGYCMFDYAVVHFSMKNGKSVFDGGSAFKDRTLNEAKKLLDEAKDLINLIEEKYGTDTDLFFPEDGSMWLFFCKGKDDTWIGSLQFSMDQNKGTCTIQYSYDRMIESPTDDL